MFEIWKKYNIAIVIILLLLVLYEISLLKRQNYLIIDQNRLILEIKNSVK